MAFKPTQYNYSSYLDIPLITLKLHNTRAYYVFAPTRDCLQDKHAADNNQDVRYRRPKNKLQFRLNTAIDLNLKAEGSNSFEISRRDVLILVCKQPINYEWLARIDKVSRGLIRCRSSDSSIGYRGFPVLKSEMTIHISLRVVPNRSG